MTDTASGGTTTVIEKIASNIEQSPATHPEVFRGQHETAKGMSVAVTTELVKGIGYARGGSKPEHDTSKLTEHVFQAQRALYDSVYKSTRNPQEVLKSVDPEFNRHFSQLVQMGPGVTAMQSFVEQLSGELSKVLGKDISLTTPLSTGIVPFDLVPPSRLIYPVYSPLRNKFPRPKGQGTSRRAKLFTGIAGSQTGTQGAPGRISIPEFPGGGSFTNWPLQLPASLPHSAVDLNVPYKFFGLTEPISWLAQFAGQGFQDISALANLILMQKFMMAEEYQLIGGTVTALNQPAAPTTAAQAARTGETTLSGVTTNVYVVVSAVNYYGETQYTVGNVATQAWAAGQTIDVTWTAVPGALSYNVYLATGAANPGRLGFFIAPNGKAVGATRLTLQGYAIPSTGANPQAADNGTASANDYDGLFSILSGNASGTYSVSASYNTSLSGATRRASVAVINAALTAMWAATKADPSEIIMEGTDIGRLSDDIRANANQSYRLLISQSELSQILAGAAVSEFVNPVTRRVISLMVHPWLPQGNAMIMSYTVPFPWSETPNTFEMVMVQDYLSVAWPVIDVTYRYSIFMYGALVGYAPIYCGLIRGLGISDTAPFS